ncbi:hypothetical protein, partial [Corynebacterium accolens]
LPHVHIHQLHATSRTLRSGSPVRAFGTGGSRCALCPSRTLCSGGTSGPRRCCAIGTIGAKGSFYPGCSQGPFGPERPQRAECTAAH